MNILIVILMILSFANAIAIFIFFITLNNQIDGLDARIHNVIATHPFIDDLKHVDNYQAGWIKVIEKRVCNLEIKIFKINERIENESNKIQVKNYELWNFKRTSKKSW